MIRSFALNTMRAHIDQTISDSEVLERSMHDPRYFEILVDRYQKPFLRKSLSIVKSNEEAEDIVQETFLKIYRYSKHFKKQPGATFRSWAYEILRNVSYTVYEKKNRSFQSIDVREHDIVDESIATPYENSTIRERVIYVTNILAEMPEKLASVLRLYFLEEKSQKEIAEIECISEGAVRTRIHRAKKFWKENFTMI